MSTISHHLTASVRSSVYYAARSGDRRLFHYAYAPHGTEETNVEFVEHVAEIADVRWLPWSLRLEVEGASMLRHRSEVRRFYDEEELRRVGYPETAELVRSVTGAADVVVFDHNIRGRTERVKAPLAESVRPPVFHIHTDFTGRSAQARAAAVLGSPLVSGQRMAAINVWRPIAEPLRDCPLAICDASSVDERDLLATDLRIPGPNGTRSIIWRSIQFIAGTTPRTWNTVRGSDIQELRSSADGRARSTRTPLLLIRPITR